MAAELLVDGFHDFNKHSPMSRCVLDLVDKYIIMNHLVNESIIEHRLIAVHEAVNLDLHVSALSCETVLAIREISKEALGGGQFDWYLWQLAFEAQIVVMVESAVEIF